MFSSVDTPKLNQISYIFDTISIVNRGSGSGSVIRGLPLGAPEHAIRVAGAPIYQRRAPDNSVPEVFARATTSIAIQDAVIFCAFLLGR